MVSGSACHTSGCIHLLQWPQQPVLSTEICTHTFVVSMVPGYGQDATQVVLKQAEHVLPHAHVQLAGTECLADAGRAKQCQLS